MENRGVFASLAYQPYPVSVQCLKNDSSSIKLYTRVDNVFNDRLIVVLHKNNQILDDLITKLIPKIHRASFRYILAISYSSQSSLEQTLNRYVEQLNITERSILIVDEYDTISHSITQRWCDNHISYLINIGNTITQTSNKTQFYNCNQNEESSPDQVAKIIANIIIQERSSKL
jgi:hypothetical protein